MIWNKEWLKSWVGDPKNVNCILFFLYVSPCSLCYCLTKTQGSEANPEPVFWVHGNWRCQGPFKSGGIQAELCFLFLCGLPRDFLSGLGQREAEAFFSFSLNSVENCLAQVSEKLHLSILDCFGGNIPTTFSVIVATSNSCPCSWNRPFFGELCFCYCHAGQSCLKIDPPLFLHELQLCNSSAAPDPVATVDRAATTRRNPVRWYGSLKFDWFWTRIAPQVLQVSFLLSLISLCCCLGQEEVL